MIRVTKTGSEQQFKLFSIITNGCIYGQILELIKILAVYNIRVHEILIRGKGKGQEFALVPLSLINPITSKRMHRSKHLLMIHASTSIIFL